MPTSVVHDGDWRGAALVYRHVRVACVPLSQGIRRRMARADPACAGADPGERRLGLWPAATGRATRPDRRACSPVFATRRGRTRSRPSAWCSPDPTPSACACRRLSDLPSSHAGGSAPRRRARRDVAWGRTWRVRAATARHGALLAGVPDATRTGRRASSRIGSPATAFPCNRRPCLRRCRAGGSMRPRLPSSAAADRRGDARQPPQRSEAFAEVFGVTPEVVVPPTFVWTDAVESAWARAGARVVVTPGHAQ